MNRNPDDPNKGLNVKTFLLSVFAALVVFLVVAAVVVSSGKTHLLRSVTAPKPNSAASPQ